MHAATLRWNVTQRFERAKRRYHLAIESAMRGDAGSESVVNSALAELQSARQALRRMGEGAPSASKRASRPAAIDTDGMPE